MSKTFNTYINHVVFLLDGSGSMSKLRDQVINVLDKQVKRLAKKSKELDQETRVSVYIFNTTTENVIYDKDVLRLPSLRGRYHPSGGTALIDGTFKAIEDLEKTAQLYGDHAFLLYVLTDGEENSSRAHNYKQLLARLGALPENWTVATFVPDALGESEAKAYGFPKENVRIWSATSDGIDDVGEEITRATDNFMQARASGVRGTESLFTLDASNLSTRKVAQALNELDPKQYELLPVRKDSVIKPFVESWVGEYRTGAAYYQLVKPEIVQVGKQLCVQHKINGKVYSGLQARNLLGLPSSEIKVKPGDHGDFDIFVQSTSVNRKLPKGTKLIVLK